MLCITLILAALILLLMVLPVLWDSTHPAIFKITKVRHTEDNGKLNYDSYVVIRNMGTTGYSNLDLYIVTYRNGEQLDCTILTVNGHTFIPTHHYKVQVLGGWGSQGKTWDPGESIYIDYKDGTFITGDVVTLEFYNSVTHEIISRDTYTA